MGGPKKRTDCRFLVRSLLHMPPQRQMEENRLIRNLLRASTRRGPSHLLIVLINPLVSWAAGLRLPPIHDSQALHMACPSHPPSKGITPQLPHHESPPLCGMVPMSTQKRSNLPQPEGRRGRERDLSTSCSLQSLPSFSSCFLAKWLSSSATSFHTPFSPLSPCQSG